MLDVEELVDDEEEIRRFYQEIGYSEDEEVEFPKEVSSILLCNNRLYSSLPPPPPPPISMLPII